MTVVIKFHYVKQISLILDKGNIKGLFWNIRYSACSWTVTALLLYVHNTQYQSAKTSRKQSAFYFILFTFNSPSAINYFFTSIEESI